jgi:hypothetical protein
MLQFALIRALLMMKKETGEMNNKSQRVGISFTSYQNTVKIPRISKILSYLKIKSLKR